MVHGAGLNAEELARLYREAAAAEQSAADMWIPGIRQSAGDPQARVLVIEGEGGGGEEAVAEDVRTALLASLNALEAQHESVLWMSSTAGAVDPSVAAERLSIYLESADPDLVIALDGVAAAATARAAGLRRLDFGKPQTVNGRTLLAVDGLAASLQDPARKRKVWWEFKSLRP